MILVRLLLFPFSLLYAFVTAVRNWMFNTGLLKSVEFDIPVISIGNLRVGGTGKTPHVEYLINSLSKEYNIATISRGYGRETRGFIIADDTKTARDIGDEPLQIFNKLKNKALVTVCEERALAIPRLLSEKNDVNLVILDDAFQHRFVKPKVNILLTTFKQPFYNDFLLPTGMLREPHYGARRADIVVITKCPDDLPEEKQESIKRKVSNFAKNNTPIFFTKLKYGRPHSFSESTNECPKQVILVSGLADSNPFVEHVKQNFEIVFEKKYADHYDYFSDDIEDMEAWLKKYPEAAILCTEKDFVKLNDVRFKDFFQKHKAYYLPVEVAFLNNEDEFLQTIQNSIK
ncbi:MAG: tetraacyldisaccharide 4'-kinase [Cytophagales bacterium]